MKKPALLLFFWICWSLGYGQEPIFFETCGIMDVSTPKKVDAYTGWDNPLPVTFSRTIALDGFADVRKTASTTNHIWFPAGKSSDLIISDIPCANYHQLVLSFSMAAYKLTDANVNKLNVSCNDSALTLPSATFPTSKFITVANIILGNATSVNLHFAYTAESNTSGYRLDSIKITGIKTLSAVNNLSFPEFNPIVSGTKLLLKNLSDGTPVVIYNTSGSIVESSNVKTGFIILNNHLTTGLYIVHAGVFSGKFLLFVR